MTHRILIVDDEQDIRDLLAMILEHAGYRVLEADSGPAALDVLATAGVDLVLLDIMMPAMSGWTVCARIKADPAVAHIPVVMLTVRSMVRDQAQYESTRPDGYISKPFLPDDLLQGVARHLAVAHER